MRPAVEHTELAKMGPARGLASAHSDEAGTSLLELLVGIVIVVIVLGAVLKMTLQHSKSRVQSQELHLALSACRNNLEELRSLPFVSIPGLHGVGFDVPDSTGNPGGLNPVPGDPDGLPGQFSVSVDKSSGPEVLYRVIALVDWTGSHGKERFSLEMLLGRRK